MLAQHSLLALAFFFVCVCSWDACVCAYMCVFGAGWELLSSVTPHLKKLNELQVTFAEQLVRHVDHQIESAVSAHQDTKTVTETDRQADARAHTPSVSVSFSFSFSVSQSVCLSVTHTHTHTHTHSLSLSLSLFLPIASAAIVWCHIFRSSRSQPPTRPAQHPFLRHPRRHCSAATSSGETSSCPSVGTSWRSCARMCVRVCVCVCVCVRACVRVC